MAQGSKGCPILYTAVYKTEVHTSNSGVEEESVLKECCKSSLKNISL